MAFVDIIILGSSFGARASMYSNGDLDAVVQFDLEVAYYNDQLYIWEPLLEPVECTIPGMPLLYYPPSDVMRHRRPIFNIDLSRNVTQQMVDAAEAILPVSHTLASGINEAAGDDEVPVVAVPKPVTTITVQTSDILQLVVSKIGLNVLKAVGEGFGKAYRVEETYASDSNDVKSMYPVILYNHTDTKFTVKPDPTLVCARIVGSEQQYSSASATAHPQHIILGSNAFAALEFNTAVTPKKIAQPNHQPSSSNAVSIAHNKNAGKLLTYEDQRSYKFTIYVSLKLHLLHFSIVVCNLFRRTNTAPIKNWL